MKLPLRTLCVLFALSFTVSVHAATRSVTKTADTNDGNCDADCSLREAVAAAAPGDTIKFLPPLFDSAQTIVLGAEIVINKNLNVTGPGANKLTIDGGPGFNRIFYMTGGTVTLSGMTLTGGHVNAAFPGFDNRGGAILAEGATQLTLDGVQVAGNQAVVGGGVYLFGTMPVVIRNSTFTGNGSSDHGSAIFNGGGGTVTITNSTIHGNTAALAAAVLNAGTGGMVIQNSTIAGNLGSNLGGVYTGSTLRLRSTIVAGNNGSYPDILVDTFGTVVSDGYNLIGDNAGVPPIPISPSPTRHPTSAIPTRSWAPSPTTSARPWCLPPRPAARSSTRAKLSGRRRTSAATPESTTTPPSRTPRRATGPTSAAWSCRRRWRETWR